MLHEISRKIININKYEETNISWNNSVLTVRGNKELHLLEFSYNLNSLNKRIDFKEFAVSSSKASPLSDKYLTEYVARGVKNLELVEMVTNPAFWPHNKLLMEELTSIVTYQWSPFHLVCENDNLLATVNSTGNVEFFGARRHSWYTVLDFSSEMKTHLTHSFDKLHEIPRNFTDVKETVYTLETASICWASYLNEDSSCYFVTAQKSGDILFWLIKYHHSDIEVEFRGHIQNKDNIEIVHMHWINLDKDENTILLVCSNEHGEIIYNECQIIKKNINLLNVHNVWTYKDKMITKYIYHHFQDDKLLLLFNKHRHLIIQMYDKNLKLLHQNIQNVNDYKITSITKHKEMFYLTTVNMKIYSIDYQITNETLKVYFNIIEVKDLGSSCELYGIAVSTNSALFAIAIINRKHSPKKHNLSIEIVLLSSISESEIEIISIINNPTKQLTHMWDVIEAFRCKTIKLKRLPQLDYNSLIQDDSDVYKLKVYLIVLNVYHNLIKYMALGLQELLPETSINVIKEKILMVQAFSQIHNVYAKYQSNTLLSSLDWECFGGSKHFMQYYCKKYNKNLTDFFTKGILNISDVQFKYLCQWCEENIEDFSCKNKHVNMICSLTFTPIDNDYLVCKSCNATANIKLYHQNPICVFCDLNLIT